MRRITCDRCGVEINHHTVPLVLTISTSSGFKPWRQDICVPCARDLGWQAHDDYSIPPRRSS